MPLMFLSVLNLIICKLQSVANNTHTQKICAKRQKLQMHITVVLPHVHVFFQIKAKHCLYLLLLTQ